MKEAPKNRLTMKELWVEGDYLTTLSKDDKKAYKALDIEEKRVALSNHTKNKNSNNNLADNNTHIPKYIHNMGLTNLSSDTLNFILSNRIGSFSNDWLTKLSSITANTKENREMMMDKEVVIQNFALIKLLDDLIKDNQELKEHNDTLINQNKEIINLLTKIADK